MEKNRKAVFPGSFDPITAGHEDIIKRALSLFDKIIIAIGNNTTKKYLFELEQRKKMVETVFGNDKIEVQAYTGLTVDFCKKNNADFILRGLRSAADFEFERAIAQMNKDMEEDIETVFLISSPKLAVISSTIIREILINKGNVNQFIPKALRNKIMSFQL